MKTRGFRGKPSPSHVVWTRGAERGSEGGTKRFDPDHLEKWANHCGFDFERETRIDHERAEEPREQFRVIFKWGKSDPETIELGDEEWSMGARKTPRTFVEVDEAGLARIRGWTVERVLDVVEMRHKGPDLLVASADGEKKRINARKFVTHPRKRQRADG
jgi:hypothetical protein